MSTLGRKFLIGHVQLSWASTRVIKDTLQRKISKATVGQFKKGMLKCLWPLLRVIEIKNKQHVCPGFCDFSASMSGLEELLADFFEAHLLLLLTFHYFSNTSFSAKTRWRRVTRVRLIFEHRGALKFLVFELTRFGGLVDTDPRGVTETRRSHVCLKFSKLRENDDNNSSCWYSSSTKRMTALAVR